MKGFLIVALIAIFAVAAFAEEEHSKHVTILTDANFKEQTSQGYWFVKFYAPWCGHCKKLAPAWDELAGKAKAEALGYNVGKIDCTVQKETCNAFAVRGYPTLILLKNGEKVEDRYNGARSIEALNAYAVGKVGK